MGKPVRQDTPMRMLRPCLSILRMQVLAKLQYRASAWAQLSTAVLGAIVQIVIILAFYKFGLRSGATSGLSAAQAVGYTWLVHITLPLLPGMGLDAEVREKIRSGDIGVELCRPLDLYTHWFARAAALRVGPFLLHVIPITLVAFLMPEPFRLHPPASLAGLLTSMLALALGLLLTCATMGLTYVVLMHVNWGDGPIYVMVGITDLLSGANLPLQLWPAFMQRFLYLQPFAGVIDLPLRLYLGTLAPVAFLQVALLQLAWIAALVLAGWLWMRRTLTHLVIQGG